jgi:hypothetical protein
MRRRPAARRPRDRQLDTGGQPVQPLVRIQKVRPRRDSAPGGARESLARAPSIWFSRIDNAQRFTWFSRYKLDSSLSLKAPSGDKYLPIGIGAVIVLQVLITYAPVF